MLRDRLYKLNETSRDQRVEIRKLKDQMKIEIEKEEKIIEKGKKHYKFDFENPIKQIKQEE